MFMVLLVFLSNVIPKMDNQFICICQQMHMEIIYDDGVKPSPYVRL
jgi:hypothetical protein